MTKLLKRIISFSMAIAISLSLSSTAFAVEPATLVTEADKDTAIIASVTTDSYALPDGYGTISDIKSGTSMRAPVSISFTVPAGGAYVYFLFSTDARFELNAYNNGVRELHMAFNSPTTTGAHRVLMVGMNFPNGYWPAGTYTAQVIFSDLNKQYAMSVFASPSIL